MILKTQLPYLHFPIQSRSVEQAFQSKGFENDGANNNKLPPILEALMGRKQVNNIQYMSRYTTGFDFIEILASKPCNLDLP